MTEKNEMLESGENRLTSEVGLAQRDIPHLRRSQTQCERKVPEQAKTDPV